MRFEGASWASCPGCGEADEEKGGGRGETIWRLGARPRTDSRIVGSLGGWSRRYKAGIPKNSHEGCSSLFPAPPCSCLLCRLTLGLLGRSGSAGAQGRTGTGPHSRLPPVVRLKLGGCAERPVFLLSGKSLTVGGETRRRLNDRLKKSRHGPWRVLAGAIGRLRRAVFLVRAARDSI